MNFGSIIIIISQWKRSGWHNSATKTMQRYSRSRLILVSVRIRIISSYPGRWMENVLASILTRSRLWSYSRGDVTPDRRVQDKSYPSTDFSSVKLTVLPPERASSKWHADFPESESISSILRYSTSSHLSYVTTGSLRGCQDERGLRRI